MNSHNILLASIFVAVLMLVNTVINMVLLRKSSSTQDRGRALIRTVVVNFLIMVGLIIYVLLHSLTPSTH